MSEELHNAAVALGRRGGQSTSPEKQAASRANGKLGGRPRKERATAPVRKLPRGAVLLLPTEKGTR